MLLTYLLTRLLQCDTCRSAQIYHCTSTTCTERCSIARLSPRDHVTSTLRELRWLPVPYRITFAHTHAPHPYRSSTVISNRHCHTNSYCRFKITSSVRQQPIRYEQPRTRLKLGQQAFSYAAPAAWNTLPTSLQQIPNIETFERHLKTFFVLPGFLTSISVL